MFVRNLYKVTSLHMRLLPEDCDTVVLIHTACVRDVCGERRSRYTDNLNNL